MRSRLAGVVLLGSFAGLIVPGAAPASDVSSIYDTLSGLDSHNVLRIAIKEAGEVGTLKGAGEYTLFAPSDAAFKTLDDAAIRKLTQGKAAVKALVQSHLVMGKYGTDQLKALEPKELRTVQGQVLKVEVANDEVRVGGAKLVLTNIRCSNGVIHVIDRVLPGK